MVSLKFTSLFASATLFTNVLATVFMTSPTASTTCTGGKVCTINWQDDGKAPNLQTFGLASVGVFVGSVTSQTELQHIQDGVNVATTSAIQFTVNPAAGDNSNAYFVRFTSAGLKDQSTGYPIQAFSAKFTLNGMSGKFNSTVQAQIDGASSAPIASPSAPASTGGSSPAASQPTSSSSSSASSKSSTTASTAGATKTGAAVHVSVKSSMAVVVGAGMLAALAF